MDLEALTSEQLELALKLSDILSMEDLTVAAAVLCSFDWNLEVLLMPFRELCRNFSWDQFSRTTPFPLWLSAQVSQTSRNNTNTMKSSRNITIRGRKTVSTSRPNMSI